METHCILLSHGSFAQACLKSAEMLAGETNGITAIGLCESTGVEAFKKAFWAEVERHGEKDLLVMVDIMGGTPSNLALEACTTNPRITVFTGLNVPMVVNYALGGCSASSEADLLLEETKNSINIFRQKDFLD